MKLHPGFCRQSTYLNTIAILLFFIFIARLNPSWCENQNYLIMPVENQLVEVPYQLGQLVDGGFKKGLDLGGALKVVNYTELNQPDVTLYQDSELDESRIKEIGKKNKVNTVFGGRLHDGNGGYTLEAFIYSVDEKKIVYKDSEECQLPEELEAVSILLAQRIVAVASGYNIAVSAFTATQGTLKDQVKLNFESNPMAEQYQIYRSLVPDGIPELIGTSNTGEYVDLTAAAGICYWYQVRPVVSGIYFDKSAPQLGYSLAPVVAPKDIEQLIKAKNKSRPKPANNDEKNKETKELALVETYYFNSVKLRLMLFVSNSYIKNGDLIVLQGFDDYVLDRESNYIYLIKKDNYVIKFHSNKLFRFLTECEAMGEDGVVLFERILQNSVLYCADPVVETASIPDDGGVVTRNLVMYKSIGMTSEYFRDYKEWSSNTLMFATSDKELQNKIKNAQKKNDSD